MKERRKERTKMKRKKMKRKKNAKLGMGKTWSKPKMWVAGGRSWTRTIFDNLFISFLIPLLDYRLEGP